MAAVTAPTTIIGSDEEVAKFLEPREPRDEDIAVPTSIAFGEEKRFIMYGDTQEYTEYATAQEMIAAQAPLPDPVFKAGDILPTIEDAGFPLDKMDEYDIAFKKMYEDMFSRTSEMGVMGAGDFEARLRSLQNELSKVMTEKGNEGHTSILSFGKQTLYASEPPSAPVHSTMSVTSTGTFLHPPEEGSFAYDAEADDERSGSPVDA
jgi:hypothetical protein